MSALGQPATYALQQSCKSFDHLVDGDQQARRNGEVELVLPREEIEAVSGSVLGQKAERK